MTTLIAFASAVFLLAAVVGMPYPTSWYERWSRSS